MFSGNTHRACRAGCEERGPAQRLLPLLVVALLLVVGGSVHGASPVPFTDTFTYDDGTSLDGTNGWVTAGSGSAIATNGRGRLADVTLANAFSGMENTVTITFDVQPTFSKNAPSAIIPADATYAFYVRTNGLITAYDGTTASNLTHAPLSDLVATQVRVRVDYPAQKWSLRVGNAEVATDFDFYGGGASVFTEIGFIEKATNAFSYIDNVSVVAATSSIPVVLPFYEPFEALDPGDLDGQRGWQAFGTVVQTSEVYAGDKAAGLSGTTAEMVHSFVDGKTDVWTDLRIQPVFGSPASSPPAGSTCALYVSTNGHVVVFDGILETQLVDTVVQSNEWVRFTVHSDYAATTWSLYLDGSPVAEGLRFYDTSATAYTEFGVRGAGSGNVYVDEIRIQTLNPLSDTPLVSFEPRAGSFGEGVADAMVTVTLDRSPTNEVRVDHFLAGGTAAFGPDFTNYAGGTLIFTPGQTSTSFTFTVIDDAEDEPDETIIFGLGNFVNSEAGLYTNFTYTILHDSVDEPRRVSFLTDEVLVWEGVADAMVTVTLDRSPTNEVRVDHFLAGGTAAFGPDFTNYAGGTLIFTPGQTSTSFTFTVIDDAEDEPDETIIFGLGNFVNSEAGLYTNFTYTILHDSFDEPPRVTFLTDDVLLQEDVTAGSVPVVLFPAQAGTVTVAHAVLDGGTATPGADYTDYSPGTLTFEPGETNKVITFTVIEDEEEEPDETILFGLSDFVNAEPGAITNFTYIIGSDSNTWYVLPFIETFEQRSLGDLDGQRGWLGENAAVQSEVVFRGAKAAALTTLTNGLSHTFVGEHRSVWTDMWIKPVFGRPDAPPAGSTFAFYVSADGYVQAYDGGSAKDLGSSTRKLTEGRWVRFTVHSDYVNKNWDLFVNSVRAATDLDFYSRATTGYSEFGLSAAGVTNAHLRAYLDDLEIGLSRPRDLPEMLLIIR